MAAFGLVLVKAAGLVTGGVAGLALSLSYRTGMQVGVLFVALNAPFFLLARSRMGWLFTIKSLLTMIGLAAFVAAMPGWLRISGVQPAFAALFGGSLIGMGMLSLARHHASVGGVSILALYLQDRRGCSAGMVQLSIDVLVLAASCMVVGGGALGYSGLSALAQSLVVIIYHRPGRYAGL